MADFIKNIQNKPEHIKRIIMWFGVVFIMAVIFIFWIFTFQWSAPSENASPSLDKLPSVWQSFKEQLDNLGNLWQK